MNLTTVRHALRRLWAQDTFVYSLRVALALGSVMAVCWSFGRMDLVMPVLLGVIACALAETDDSLRGRLRAVLVTMGCFVAVALAVQALAAHVVLFGLALPAAAFALTLLGAVGERYRAIGYATLIVVLYTAIGLEHLAASGIPFWQRPLPLLAGAAWYGAISLVWAALFAHQPVQQNLALLFDELAEALWIKSSMFEPVRGIDVARRRIALARHNGRVVQALNTAKESLFRRIGTGTVASTRMRRYLGLYFIAQDVHERASSSHYAYDELTDAFFHSDVMFRGQRLLSLQGRACLELARAIRMREPFEKQADSLQAMADLRAAIDHLRHRPPADRPETPGRTARLLRSLQALADNLAALDATLTSAGRPPAEHDAQRDSSLFDRSPRTARDAIGRVRQQLGLASPLFRHAVRLSLALGAGYAAMQAMHVQEGWWVVLTTLFVCQPGYGATRLRMLQRVAGTFGGLVVGWMLFGLFHQPLVQATLAVVAGIVFFAARRNRYALATGAITLLVLLCFNQIGNGYDLIVPRMVDTVAGALIAGVAVFLVLPDWQGRRLETTAAHAVGASARYLQAILQQYLHGKQDDLAYRLARRNAHNADAALSSALVQMLQEPGFLHRNGEAAIRFMVLSHTLLNYLSALGAHRGAVSAHGRDPLLEQAGAFLMQALGQVASHLADHRTMEAAAPESLTLAAALEAHDGSDGLGLEHIQMALLCRMVEPLRAGAARLVEQPAVGWNTAGPAPQAPAEGLPTPPPAATGTKP
ncbi:YccS family putative transporter [Xylophilus sp. Leaf220]|uniref:YccS family putative transporter n=1 Tax=Xylophilus sp. Leaf220 TaxID=1735686 RepID=UPI0009E94419|nr:YccS family putative transporter [Xylophilus sp. Leaf220]